MIPINYKMHEFLTERTEDGKNIFRTFILDNNIKRHIWKQFLKGNISAGDLMD